ncbi:MAG TPA: hypothetical protein PLU72_08095 [Candidatus Ozemobacteraceae bacterium]|nr:hypothetical protein [Candidatus Ozemobacteraceae bacterium]
MSQERKETKSAVTDEFQQEDRLLDEGAQPVIDAILLEKYELAERRLGELKNRTGETATTMFLSGKLLLARNETGAAYNVFKKLHYELPVFMGNRREYTDLRAMLLTRQLEKARAQWQEILSRSLSLLEPQHTDEAAADKDPQKMQAELIPDIEECLEIYKKVLEIEPMHIDGLRGLSVCYSELGRADLIVQLKDRLHKAQEYWIEMNKKRSHLVWVECKALASVEKYEDALRVAGIVEDVLPIHRGLVLLKGEILFKLGRLRESRACVDTLLRLVEGDNEALRLKKKIELQSLEESLIKGQECLLFAEEQLAGSTSQMKKAKEALDHYLEALAADSFNLRALVGAYKCHLLTNNPIKARLTMERIQQIEPNYPIGDMPTSSKTTEEEKTEPCFVATRLFGADAPETNELRRFREETLRTSGIGRVAIAGYRRLGPRMARVSPGFPLLTPMRTLLRSVAAFTRRRRNTNES